MNEKVVQSVENDLQEVVDDLMEDNAMNGKVLQSDMED